MKNIDIVKVLKAAKQRPYNHIEEKLIPGWDYRRLSEVIGYCVDDGLVKAISVTHLTSPHPEYILQGITSKGEDYLEDSRLLRRLSSAFEKRWIPIVGFVASIVTIAGALHWWR